MTVFLMSISTHDVLGDHPHTVVGQRINNGRGRMTGGYQTAGSTMYIENGEGPQTPLVLNVGGAHWLFFAKDKHTVKKAFERYQNAVLKAGGGKFYGLLVGEYRNDPTVNRTWRKFVLGIKGSSNGIGRKNLVHGLTLDALNDKGYFVLLLSNNDFKNNFDRSVKHMSARDTVNLAEIASLM